MQEEKELYERIERHEQTIQQLTEQVNRMQIELNRLTGQMHSANSVAEQQHIVDIWQQPALRTPQWDEPQPPVSQTTVPVQKADKDVHNYDDMEKKIGKSFMGIVASALIFVSLILFATLIYPYLNDTIKICAMYVISGAFLVTGLLLLRRDRDSRLYISLAGCGVGAIYISLLLTNIYFGVIGDITLYILILGWVIGVCFLSKLQSWVFLVIGQAGVFISMCFGHEMCASAQDTKKLLILTLFFVVAFSIFFISHLCRKFNDNTTNHVFFILNMLLFYLGLSTRYEDMDNPYKLAVAILVIFIWSYIIFCFVYMELNQTKHNMEFGVVGLFDFWGAFWLTGGLVQILNGNESSVSVLFILLSVGALCAVEYKFRKQNAPNGDVGKMPVVIGLFLLLVIGTMTLDGMVEYCHLFLWTAAALFAGFRLRDNLYKWIGMVMMTWFAFSFDMNHLLNLIGGILLFAGLTCMLYKPWGQYNSVIKSWSYPLLQIMLLKDGLFLLDDCGIDESWKTFFVLLVQSIVSVTAICSSYSMKQGKTEKDKVLEYVTGFIQICLMIESLSLMVGVRDDLCHALIICVSLLLFMVNSLNIIKRYNQVFVDVYVGCKFTVWLVVMLTSCHATNYIISLMCFALAIVSIVAGFTIKRKALRIYGLVLSLVSVVKLVLIDIYYDNSIARALSFFAAGLLCFGISSIYNYIDKRMRNKEKDN